MELIIKKNKLLILPQNDQDEAFIEHSLGLLKDGDFLKLERKSKVAIGYGDSDTIMLETSKNES